MFFALLGDHEDGLAVARALAESGRHRLLCYAGPALGVEYLRRWNLTPQIVVDVEEVLANPAVEAVIVAVPPANRAALLRRAAQAERHVLCVHPADQKPDSAYEAASIQRETNCVVLPLLPEAFHPGLQKLAGLIAKDRESVETSTERFSHQNKIREGAASAEPSPGESRERTPPSPPCEGGEGGVRSQEPHPPGPDLLPRLIQIERWSTEAILYDVGIEGHLPGFPGWEMLRYLAGEIVEVSAFAHGEEVNPADLILLAGRFEKGGLFQTLLLPQQPQARLRLTVLLRFEQAELLFPEGLPGPARLTWPDENGQKQEENWKALDPWQTLVEVFEASLAFRQGQKPSADKRTEANKTPAGLLSWEDEIRCLELDDAARRSIERRRSSTLEYQEAFEEASFKGTMTLAGCALLWISLFLLILSIWIPMLGWVIAPLFGFFILLQLLRWVIPPRERAGEQESGRAEERETGIKRK